jgi:superfamily II DNA/RNA helicase
MSKSFSDFNLQPKILAALERAGFDSPMPIQEKAIPILMEGRDLIGVAETGTGKTLAFLLPIFRHMKLGGAGPQAMVICPTRELAMQVAGEAERFGKDLGVRIVLAYGGTSSGEQKRLLSEGCDLVVGTPGRLLDFVNSAWLSLRGLRYLVLDEADRMLDMGFINDVDAILRRTPMSRQTMLFSATISKEVRDLSQRYMFDPALVRMHRGARVKASVEHALYPVRQSQKIDLLVEILCRERPAKFLVFTATREGTSELALRLRRHRFEVISLSSLLSQPNRERALTAFRNGECQALVATDVAARGLDITDIDLVVNFDVPMQAEDYVHRIGRTGRAERTGKAITLVSELDSRRVADIERLLGDKVPRVELEGFQYSKSPAGRERRGGARPARNKSASRGGRGRGGKGKARKRSGKPQSS